MTHLETLDNGLTTVKLIGKLLREKITIEGLFKSYRVFASNRVTDGRLLRRKVVKPKGEKFGNTPDHSFIYNDSVIGVKVPPELDKQPSVYNSIGKKGIRRAKVIEDYANTITTRQDRTPAQVIDLGDGKYRYLTELECWRLMGYSDEDYYAAESTCKVEPGKMNRTLYHQSGNSIVVPIFEEMFRVIISDILERKDVNVQK